MNMDWDVYFSGFTLYPYGVEGYLWYLLLCICGVTRFYIANF